MEHCITPLLWHIPEIQVSYKRVTGVPYPKITTSKDAYEILIRTWDMDTIELQEQFRVMLLNRGSKAFGIYSLSQGGITGTIVDVRLLFGIALKTASTAIIVAHNHPSGNIYPSVNDKQVTDEIASIGKLLNIKLIDHLIVTTTQYYSFSDEGELTTNKPT